MTVHSGGRPVDPAVLAATRAAVPEARAAVAAVSGAVSDGDRAAAAEAVVGYLTATGDPVRYPARVNALMSVLIQLAARVAGQHLPTRSGAVLSLVAPAGADPTRRAALAAISCAANHDVAAAVDVLLAHAAAQRSGGPCPHPYAELVVDLCVVVEQLAGGTTG